MGKKSSKIVSKYKNIYWCDTDKRWRVIAYFNGKQHGVGNFESEELAYDWLDKFNQIVHPDSPIILIDGEIWKDILLSGVKYGVSNKGRVKSYNYRGTGREKVLSPYLNGFGYYVVVLQGKTRFVHTLVMMGFYGISTKKVNHKDENKQNNYIENLEYVSNRINVCYSLKKDKGVPIGAHQRRSGNWGAMITVHGKRIWLGTFKTAEEASAVYLNTLKEHGFIDDYNYLTSMMNKST